MPANHCKPHTAEAKLKMSIARKGKPLLKKQRKPFMVNGEEKWKCSSCGALKNRNEFFANKRSPCGLQTQCKPCHKECVKRTRNRELCLLSKRRSSAVRRARGGEKIIPQKDIDTLLGILGQKCLQCGSMESIQLDHIQPLAKGGAHHPLNLQPLCRKHNEIKQARYADFRTDKMKQQLALSFKARHENVDDYLLNIQQGRTSQ